jgi:membrane associated rhomboid family serine protease
MIPIRTERRPAGPFIAVWAIALACLAVLVRLAYLDDTSAAAIVSALAVVPARFVATPLALDQLVTLVSSAFLHAGWVHLLGNLLYLYVFGPTVESRLGLSRFALLYLASGAAGALAHIASDPSSTAPLVGASGAIAGVLGAYLILEPRSHITTVVPVIIFIEIASLPAAFVIAFWFMLQVASALAPITGEIAREVAWFAHLGGFAAGVLIALPTAMSGATRIRTHKARSFLRKSRRTEAL